MMDAEDAEDGDDAHWRHPAVGHGAAERRKSRRNSGIVEEALPICEANLIWKNEKC